MTAYPIDKRIVRHYNYGMTYVRAKTIKGQIYYYLVESQREGDKVRQRVIKYLGKERPSAKELERIFKQLGKRGQEK